MVCDDVIGGSGRMPCRAVACRDGFVYRLDRRVFAAAFDASPVIRHLVFVCVRLLMAQVSQITFCSRHHVLKHQLCRWFLLAYDRTRSIEIQVTHSMLAQMLGVRRETVTDAAGEIQKLGLIRQYRSSIGSPTSPASKNVVRLPRDRARRDEAHPVGRFGRAGRIARLIGTPHRDRARTPRAVRCPAGSAVCRVANRTPCLPMVY